MPVIFAQPGFGGGCAGGGGSLHHGYGEALRAQQGAWHAQTERDRLELQRQQMGQQAAQFAASREVSPRDAWQAQEHVRSSLAIHEGQLTQSEQMRLQRLNTALSSIDDAFNQGQLTREQYGELRNEAQGMRTPLQMRQAQTQQRIHEQQLRHAEDENQRQVVQRNRNAQAASGGLHSLTQPIYNEPLRAQIETQVRQEFPQAPPAQIQQIAMARLNSHQNGVIGYHMAEMASNGNVTMRPWTMSEITAAGRTTPGGRASPAGAQGAGAGTPAGETGSPAGRAVSMADLRTEAMNQLSSLKPIYPGTAATPTSPRIPATPQQLQQYNQQLREYHDAIDEHVDSALGRSRRSGAGEEAQQSTPQTELRNFESILQHRSTPEIQRQFAPAVAEVRRLLALPRLTPDDQIALRTMIDELRRIPMPNNQAQLAGGPEAGTRRVPLSQRPLHQRMVDIASSPFGNMAGPGTLVGGMLGR